MLCVVSPVDHTLSVAEEEVSTTDSPEQKVVGPLAEIVGVGIVDPMDTTTGADVCEGQPPTVVVTV